jgi:universal stress protein A
MREELFNKILCPVDFGGYSHALIEAASAISRGTQPTLYLLHVVSTTPVVAGVPLEPHGVTGHDIETELRQMIPSHTQGQLRFEVIARKGNPGKEILRAIRELGVDSVVIATHGRKGLSRALLGSVAEQVVRGSRVPVLTIRI